MLLRAVFETAHDVAHPKRTNHVTRGGGSRYGRSLVAHRLPRAVPWPGHVMA